MASIRKRRTSDGAWRWDVRWRVDGKQRDRAFRRAKDAEVFKRQVESDELKGLTVDPSRGQMPFSVYAEDWLATRRRVDGRALAPRTVELYRYLLDRWLLPEFGTVSLAGVRSDRVRIWHAGMAEESSPLQAAKSYRLLRVILNTAVADERLTRNPCTIRGAGTERTKERPFVDADVVLGLADAIDPRYRAIVLLAGFGGLRLGELLALRRCDLDLDAGVVRVEAQAVELRDGTRVVTAPKTDAGTRSVHLPGLVSSVLREHLEAYGPTNPAGVLFTGPLSEGLRRATFYKEWDQARKAVGYPQLHLHDLRHAAGTLAAQTGATLREVMARLGHASPAAAQRYQHAAERRDRVIAEALDVVLDAAARSRTGADGPGLWDGCGMEPDIDPLPGGGISLEVGLDQDISGSGRRESNSRSQLGKLMFYL